MRNDSESDELKSKADSVRRTEKWLVNAYVIKDAKTTENEGKIMIVRYGKQLQKIIMDAIEGEGSEDFGPRIFDLTSNGCNFTIKVEKQGDYPTYVSSKFGMPKPIDGLDEGKIDGIYSNSIDLASVLPVKSFDEIQALLAEHFYCTEDTSSAERTESAVVSRPAAPVKTQTVTASSDSDSLIDEDKVNELLKGLEDLD
jgi:hypothetical protein